MIFLFGLTKIKLEKMETKIYEYSVLKKEKNKEKEIKIIDNKKRIWSKFFVNILMEWCMVNVVSLSWNPMWPIFQFF